MLADALAKLAFAQVAGDGVIPPARAAEVLREAAEAPMTGFEREEYDAAVARLRQPDEEALRRAWADGRLMTADADVAFALSHGDER